MGNYGIFAGFFVFSAKIWALPRGLFWEPWGISSKFSQKPGKPPKRLREGFNLKSSKYRPFLEYSGEFRRIPAGACARGKLCAGVLARAFRSQPPPRRVCEPRIREMRAPDKRVFWWIANALWRRAKVKNSPLPVNKQVLNEAFYKNVENRFLIKRAIQRRQGRLIEAFWPFFDLLRSFS